jgi:uncharacterized membrane protein
MGTPRKTRFFGKLKSFLGKYLNHETGMVVASKIAAIVGSWPYIIAQTTILLGWLFFNIAMDTWDPYPFVALNLYLTFQAAFFGPMIMMAQNKQSETDSDMLRKDYEIAEASMATLKSMAESMTEMQRSQAEVMRKILEEEEPRGRGTND